MDRSLDRSPRSARAYFRRFVKASNEDLQELVAPCAGIRRASETRRGEESGS